MAGCLSAVMISQFTFMFCVLHYPIPLTLNRQVAALSANPRKCFNLRCFQHPLEHTLDPQATIYEDLLSFGGLEMP